MANLFLLSTLAFVCLILANEASGKSVDIPSDRFQLQNPATGKCAIIPNHSNAYWEKLVIHKCKCDDEYQFWKYNDKTLVSQGGIKQCMANWEVQGYPGVTQCLCDFGPIHTWTFSANEDGTFGLANSVDGRCVSVADGYESTPLEFDECDWTDEDQKWIFYDACHPEPPPTPKPTPPPAPPTPPPQPINVIPTYLVYFFNNGNMNWLTPTRYTLLVGGRWDAVALIWYTVDGREIKPNTDMWTMYFGNTNPSFLGALFPGGKTWNDVFGWMTIDFFKTWTGWNPAPNPAPPPQPSNVIPTYLVYFFNNGNMNWLTPTRYTLLVGGHWDPVTLTWYTVDGRQVKPNTQMWTMYFGDMSPSFLGVLFQGGKTWNDVFGWMTIEFFKTWAPAPTPAPTPVAPVNPIPPIPQPVNVIPNNLSPYFTNGQMNWLNPERYNLLIGGRWDPVNYVWYTADGRQIRPSTPDWTTYFGELQPSQMNIFFPNGGSWNDVFGWISPTFFQSWTGWQQVYSIPIVISGYIPTATSQLFASGNVNWLTPDRIKMLAGGQWTGSEYVTSTQLHVVPNTPMWTEYFGPADSAGVNTLFGGPGSWDMTFGWLTDAVKNVPSGMFLGGTIPWNNFFRQMMK